jgi:hypothetical protein
MYRFWHCGDPVTHALRLASTMLAVCLTIACSHTPVVPERKIESRIRLR